MNDSPNNIKANDSTRGDASVTIDRLIECDWDRLLSKTINRRELAGTATTEILKRKNEE